MSNQNPQPRIVSPGHPSTLLSNSLGFRARLPLNSSVDSLSIKLLEKNGEEVICRDAEFELLDNLEELELLGRVDISDLIPSDSSPAKQYSLLVSSNDCDSSNKINLAIEPKSRWDIARGGFISPDSGILGSDLIAISGWAAKRNDVVERVEINVGGKIFTDAQVGISSPQMAISLPDLREARNCIFSKVISRKDLAKTGKAAVPISAICHFKSGDQLKLVTYDLSMREPDDRLSGEIEKVYLNSLGAVIVEGWIFYPGCKPPRIELESASQVLAGSRLTTWLRREEVEWANLSHAESRNYGFRLIIPPLALGHSPGFVRLKAAIGTERAYIGKSSFWIKIGTLLHRRSPRSGIRHECKQTIAALGALYRPGSTIIPRPPLNNRRIAFCSHNLSAVEGAPKVLERVIKSLLDLGFESDSISVFSAAGGELEKRFTDLGIETEVIAELKLSTDNWESYGKGFSEISKRIVEKDCSLVFANTVDCFWGIRAAHAAGVPKVWCLHESTRPEALLLHTDRRLKLQCLETFSYSSRLLFVSEASRQQYAKFFNLNDSVVIPNGIDLVAWDKALGVCSKEEARGELGLSADEKLILMVGTTTWRKGQDVAIRAMAELKKLSSIKARLLIVGARKSDFLRELILLADKLGVSNQIEFVHETSDIHKYYRAADVALIASREESSPLVSLEAFASSLPLVSTTVFGLQDQIKDDSNALAVETDSETGFANSLNRLFNDDDLCKRLADSAREDVEQQFTMKQSMEAYLKVINGLLPAG